ncbi:hypothetical protein LJB90_00220 [Eubacteriales bacterium OttesenSCG-928-G02]|nr:hypothetical protein [Eubacteriales bacterium OttesenSCG-928-G02]
MEYKSNRTKNEIIKKWDEVFSPERFAGADETMDPIFISKRKNNSVKLVRRTQAAYDPFATVFRGKILDTENGSVIKGFYTKQLIDYIICMIFAFFFIIIVTSDISPFTTNEILISSGVILAVFIFFLYPSKKTKSKYDDYIQKTIV